MSEIVAERSFCQLVQRLAVFLGHLSVGGRRQRLQEQPVPLLSNLEGRVLVDVEQIEDWSIEKRGRSQFINLTLGGEGDWILYVMFILVGKPCESDFLIRMERAVP